MKTADTTTRRVTLGVSAIGLFAGGDSYTHIYGLVRDWHGNVISAALTPLALDGMVYALTAAKFAASRKGVPVPFKIHFWYWIGTLSTLLANGASGWHDGTGTAMLNTLSVICYIGCTEALTWILRHVSPPAKKPAPVTASKPHPQPASSPAPIDAPTPPAAPEPDDAPHDELGDRREQKKTYAPRRPLEELLAEAQQKFADDLSAGKIPGQKKISDAVSCGPGKAEEIQRRLEALRTA